VVRVPGVTGRADRCREGNYPERQVEEKERKEKKRKKEGGWGKEEHGMSMSSI
jgi:hypothetical protein